MRERYADALSRSKIAVAEAIEALVIASTPEIVAATGLSERGAQGVLKRLVEKGVAVVTGAERSTRYRLAD